MTLTPSGAEPAGQARLVTALVVWVPFAAAALVLCGAFLPWRAIPADGLQATIAGIASWQGFVVAAAGALGALGALLRPFPPRAGVYAHSCLAVLAILAVIAFHASSNPLAGLGIWAAQHVHYGLGFYWSFAAAVVWLLSAAAASLQMRREPRDPHNGVG
jgi:amino acid transporter